MKEEHIVSFSRTKLFFLVLGSGIFTWLGFIAFNDTNNLNKTIGLLTMSFFGYALIMHSLKLLDFSPGMIINSEGVFDNSSGIGAGLIPWNEINKITISKSGRQRFVTIHVSNPEKYMKSRNFIKNIFTRLNNVFYESPIHISSNTLAISFVDLTALVEKSFELYQPSNKMQEPI